MNVLVCIKQVPDNSVVPKLDPNTNRVITEGVEVMESPFDLNAVEAGLKLVEENGGEVSVLTLGGDGTKTSLRYGLSMGASKAYLLKDAAFEDSDSWGTSYGLAKAIKSIGDFDVILWAALVGAASRPLTTTPARWAPALPSSWAFPRSPM